MMDSGNIHGDGDLGETSPKSGGQLPPDLPKSLDDRRTLPHFGTEIEIYDAWQGAK